MEETTIAPALDRLIPRPRRVRSTGSTSPRRRSRLEAVRHGDLAQSPLVVRSSPSARCRAPRRQTPRRGLLRIADFRLRPERPGFQVLIDAPPHEVAVGAIGKVWRLEIPFVHLTSAEAFAAFADAASSRSRGPSGFRSRRGRHAPRVRARVDATDDESWRKSADTSMSSVPARASSGARSSATSPRAWRHPIPGLIADARLTEQISCEAWPAAEDMQALPSPSSSWGR